MIGSFAMFLQEAMSLEHVLADDASELAIWKNNWNIFEILFFCFFYCFDGWTIEDSFEGSTWFVIPTDVLVMWDWFHRDSWWSSRTDGRLFRRRADRCPFPTIIVLFGQTRFLHQFLNNLTMSTTERMLNSLRLSSSARSHPRRIASGCCRSRSTDVAAAIVSVKESRPPRLVPRSCWNASRTTWRKKKITKEKGKDKHLLNLAIQFRQAAEPTTTTTCTSLSILFRKSRK